MTRWLEICAFVTLALALHVLAFARPAMTGLQAGGSGGEEMVSIKAAAAAVTEMVATWERPITTPQTTPQLLTPPQSTARAAVKAPRPDLSRAPRAPVTIAMTSPARNEPINIDTSPPPPPAPQRIAQTKPEPPKPPKKSEIQPEQGIKANKASASRKKETAAGTGGAAQAGQGSADATTGKNTRTAQLQAVWGSKIRARIERNKQYPRGSQDSGSVSVAIQVSRDGRLLGYRMRASSGSAVLDKAAMSAVTRAKRFPKAPKNLPGQTFNFAVTLKLSP